ncbi:unnamed protein product, partial [Meganyctiphanes norvegica]
MSERIHDFLVLVVVCLTIGPAIVASDQINALPNPTLDCPNGWQNVAGNCFFISKVNKTWENAMIFCEDTYNGSSLAQSTNKEQNQALFILLKGSDNKEKLWENRNLGLFIFCWHGQLCISGRFKPHLINIRIEECLLWLLHYEGHYRPLSLLVKKCYKALGFTCRLTNGPKYVGIKIILKTQVPNPKQADNSHVAVLIWSLLIVFPEITFLIYIYLRKFN